MTDFWTVENAFFVMVILIVVQVAFALIVSPNVDQVIHTLRGMGFDAGAGTAWDTTSAFWSCHNILILFMYCPGPIGVMIFLISCSRRSRRDTIADGAEAGAIYGLEE